MPTTKHVPLKQPGYVNYRGERIGLVDHGMRKRAKPEEESFHKGWRVVGIRPGALQEEEKRHPQLIADTVAWNERVASDKSAGRARPVPGPWDPVRWLKETKKTPIRSKPYSLQSAAAECKALAERAGWLAVEIVEIKREAQKD